MDGAGPSSQRGFRFRTPAPHLHLYSNASRQGVIGVGEVVPHHSSRIEGDVLALPSFWKGHWSSCDRDVR